MSVEVGLVSLQSASDYCAEYAECPVLIVKPPKKFTDGVRRWALLQGAPYLEQSLLRELAMEKLITTILFCQLG